jgi:hypothetical protein
LLLKAFNEELRANAARAKPLSIVIRLFITLSPCGLARGCFVAPCIFYKQLK